MSQLLVPPDLKLVLPSRSALARASRVKRGMEGIDLRTLGMLFPIEGGADGYNSVGDVITQTADGRSLNDIWTEFQASLAIHNEARSAIVDFLTFPVVNPI